nr:hypothetical protein [uncultured Desulfobacter sp.]
MKNIVNTAFAQEFQTAEALFKNFIESGAQETVIDFHASYQSNEKCEEMGLDDPISLRSRLIRVKLEISEERVLFFMKYLWTCIVNTGLWKLIAFL